MAKLMLCLAIFASSTGTFAQSVTGEWNFQLFQFGDESAHAHVVLRADGEKVSGTLNELKLDGTIRGHSLVVEATRPDGKPFGELRGEISGDSITGQMKCSPREDTMCEWKARRIDAAAYKPQTHVFAPTQYVRLFSGSAKPALHIRSGDTVRTSTVDAGGVDVNGKARALGGNPQTGPFFIEGALPGDTLAIRIDRLSLNRDTAFSGGTIVPQALAGEYNRNAHYQDFDSSWALDRERGMAGLAHPTDRLKNFRVETHPMLGCIAVAPARNEAFRTAWLGPWGGNLDYNKVREGTTVYLPVMQEGALLFVGDAHALEGDGELNGDALETSSDLVFTVQLIRGQSIDGPRFEDDAYIMASGIAGSLHEALQQATMALALWIERDYKLSPNESNVVLGAAIEYDIAEVVDPQYHVVAKIRKSVLATLAAQ
jgi:acetamidase/formamidase